MSGETLESLVYSAVSSGVAVELLTGVDEEGIPQFGVRLRPFGKLLPRDVMVIAGGASFLEALQTAWEKGEDGRWERLAWESRPWVARRAETPFTFKSAGKL